jgi:leucyl/phenylalanyl-tRNA--protein transferase
MRPRFPQLSKAAQEDNYKLLDCQVYNPHLESLGCREIDRVQFMDLIEIRISSYSGNQF